MNSKILVILLLLFSVNSFSADYDNIFVTNNIEEHLPEFLAMEITKDFKESIIEYNQNRKNPKFFLSLIKDAKMAKSFTETTKDIILPEILQKEDSSYFYLKLGNNRLEFNSTIFFNRTYFLNGVKKELKNETIVSLNTSLQKNLQNLISSLIQSAVADDDADFKSAYKNLDSTKIFMAALMALDSSFKSRSFMDKIPFAGDVAQSNIKNLIKKIDGYQNKCQSALEAQAPMFQTSKTKSSDYMDMSTIDQKNMMRSLRDTLDPNYQLVLKMVKAISDEAGSFQADSKLVDKLNIDKKALACEKMLKPIIAESSSKTNVLASYLDGGNGESAAFKQHPCTKITHLKLCLQAFSTQASEINNFIGKRGKDAKDAGVVPVSPGYFNNYPSENISR